MWFIVSVQLLELRLLLEQIVLESFVLKGQKWVLRDLFLNRILHLHLPPALLASVFSGKYISFFLPACSAFSL